jgi:hypothetical protein
MKILLLVILTKFHRKLINVASSSKEPVQTTAPTTLSESTSQEYMDMQDIQDPYEDYDNYYTNWDGCGLFWDIPFSKEYYGYHNS